MNWFDGSVFGESVFRRQRLLDEAERERLADVARAGSAACRRARRVSGRPDAGNAADPPAEV